MEKTLIIYHSLHGSVRAVAQKIAEQTGADLAELTIPGTQNLKGFRMYFRLGFMASAKRCPKITGADTADITQYDRLIIGSPVWAGTFSPAIRTFFSDRSVGALQVAAFFCHRGGIGRTAAKLDQYLNMNGRLVSADCIDPVKNNLADSFAADFLQKAFHS